jgi:hypothetical protein
MENDYLRNDHSMAGGARVAGRVSNAFFGPWMASVVRIAGASRLKTVT